MKLRVNNQIKELKKTDVDTPIELFERTSESTTPVLSGERGEIDSGPDFEQIDSLFNNLASGSSATQVEPVEPAEPDATTPVEPEEPSASAPTSGEPVEPSATPVEPDYTQEFNRMSEKEIIDSLNEEVDTVIGHTKNKKDKEDGKIEVQSLSIFSKQL